MKGWRILLLLVVLGAGAAAFWLSRTPDQGNADDSADAAQLAYDYEANDVVLRQMGPDGRLAFQIEAKEITQEPDSGRISASGITMYHDPPGTEPGGPDRWTLTAEKGELPAEGGVVTLTGKVRAQGVLGKNRTQMTVATERLRYDMTAQVLSVDEGDAYRLTYGSMRAQGRGLSANIKTSDVKMGSASGTNAP